MSRRGIYWGPKPADLQAVRLAAVHEFLTRRGYAQQPSSIREMRYYEHAAERLDDGRPLYYFFPASDHFVEYPDCVLGFIEAQAKLWGLDPWDVLAELQGGPVAQPVPAPVPA